MLTSLDLLFWLVASVGLVARCATEANPFYSGSLLDIALTWYLFAGVVACGCQIISKRDFGAEYRAEVVQRWTKGEF